MTSARTQRTGMPGWFSLKNRGASGSQSTAMMGPWSAASQAVSRQCPPLGATKRVGVWVGMTEASHWATSLRKGSHSLLRCLKALK